MKALFKFLLAYHKKRKRNELIARRNYYLGQVDILTRLVSGQHTTQERDDLVYATSKLRETEARIECLDN